MYSLKFNVIMKVTSIAKKCSINVVDLCNYSSSDPYVQIQRWNDVYNWFISLSLSLSLSQS